MDQPRFTVTLPGVSDRMPNNDRASFSGANLCAAVSLVSRSVTACPCRSWRDPHFPFVSCCPSSASRERLSPGWHSTQYQHNKDLQHQVKARKAILHRLHFATQFSNVRPCRKVLVCAFQARHPFLGAHNNPPCLRTMIIAWCMVGGCQRFRVMASLQSGQHGANACRLRSWPGWSSARWCPAGDHCSRRAWLRGARCLSPCRRGNTGSGYHPASALPRTPVQQSNPRSLIRVISRTMGHVRCNKGNMP